MVDSGSDSQDGGALTLQVCSFCQINTTEWMHRLDWDRASFRVYGKGHIWAPEVGLCGRCERLYQARDDDGLVAVYHREWQKTDEDVQEGIRNPLAAFRLADLGGASMAQWLPPGVVEATRAGFTPLSDLAGDDLVVTVWPDEHRRAVPETRPDKREFSEDGNFWLVRSPWPDIPIQEVIDLMWTWVDERHPIATRRIPGEDAATRQARFADDERTRRDLQRQFLSLNQTAVLDYQGTRPPATD